VVPYMYLVVRIRITDVFPCHYRTSASPNDSDFFIEVG
jgi:hypothetical protein